MATIAASLLGYSCSSACASPPSAYLLSFHSIKTHWGFISSSPKTTSPSRRPALLRFSCPRSYPGLTVSHAVEVPTHDAVTVTDPDPQPSLNGRKSNSRDHMLPKIDKSGRFCSPRAARELALMLLYAACLDGSDPVRLFEKRLNARKETEYEFDKAALLEYNHMSFGGPPVTTQTMEEAREILRTDQKESDVEACVLSAPLKLVYSKLMLRFSRKLLVAVTQKWDSNVLAIDTVAPPSWKREPAGRILEFSILHLAMSEIMVLGTRHQIVINEAVDLAKRFCDGEAPRVINGCLRTFVKELDETRVGIEVTV